MRVRMLGVALLLTMLVSLFASGTTVAQEPIVLTPVVRTPIGITAIATEPVETILPTRPLLTATPTRLLFTPTPTRSLFTATPTRPLFTSTSTATPTRPVFTPTPTRPGFTPTPTRPGFTPSPTRPGFTPSPTPTRPLFTYTPTPTRLPPPDCGPMDVVFLIDDTGSMGGAINNVKAGITSIINDVNLASGGNYQLGLISFKDNINVLNPLAAGNAASVTANVQALFAGAGSSEPEASDEALNTAINNLPAAGRPQNIDFTGVWRPAATKIIVLVTDARPGGFDDIYTAGVDDVNAHARALQAQARGILISAVYVPTGGVNTTIQTIMQDYASTTGGVYKLTASDGTGTADAIRDILAECGGRSDVYIKDHPSDVGNEPHTLDPIWNSPDIKVCRSATGCATSENPVVGATNYIFVTLRNNGPNVVPPRTSLGSLHVYSTRAGGAASWPASWTQIDVASNLSLAPNEVRTVRLTWNLASGTGHYCLLARWVSPSDPMTHGETTDTLRNTRYNNNIAWKNVDAVALPAGASVTRDFAVRNTQPRAVATDLVFTVPDVFLGQGTLVVDLGQRLGEARIQGLTLAADADEGIGLIFTASPGAAPGNFAVQVRQFSPDPTLPTETPTPAPSKTAIVATAVPVGASATALNEPLVDVGGVEYSVTIR